MLNKYDDIRALVEKKLSCSAHNMDHVIRVYQLSMQIAEAEENVDMDVLVPAVLMHDIARVLESEDDTGETDHAVLGSEMSEMILREMDFDEGQIDAIKHCILTHRFRTDRRPETIEAKILFDADKLDVIGATGLCRTYMLAGQYGQKLYIEALDDDYTKENTVANGRLKNLSKHSPNVEYEIKFKSIPEKVYTKKAKEIAKERLTFMGSFFDRLKSEIDGNL